MPRSRGPRTARADPGRSPGRQDRRRAARVPGPGGRPRAAGSVAPSDLAPRRWRAIEARRRAWRALSQPSRRPAWRETYPGNIFCPDARLPEHGGGAPAPLPLVQTEGAAPRGPASRPTWSGSPTNRSVACRVRSRGGSCRPSTSPRGRGGGPARRGVPPSAPSRAAGPVYARLAQPQTYARLGTQPDAAVPAPDARRACARGAEATRARMPCRGRAYRHAAGRQGRAVGRHPA